MQRETVEISESNEADVEIIEIVESEVHDNMENMQIVNDVIIEFIDLLPIPLLTLKTKSNRCGKSDILTASPYKKKIESKKEYQKGFKTDNPEQNFEK